jgi:hypothetical protein
MKKKLIFKSFFCRARKIREKSHLSNVTSQRNYLLSFVHHLNQRKMKKSLIIEISSTKRSIIELIIFSTKK